ncbi:ankyrin repeat-containing domain protein [Mycena sp. CBHHK59/15]|nr:ankyrin repeat-containing domain protein [Mycena sp. CBHHK59/15]
MMKQSKESKQSASDPPTGGAKSSITKDSVISNLTTALSLVEKVANVAQTVPLIAPVASLLSEILKTYKEVKDTHEKRDKLLAHIIDITTDLCGTILRMEVTNHADLIGRLKADVETYAALITRAHAGITKFDGRKHVFKVLARNELGSELSALNRELDSFAARFRTNRLVDLVITQGEATATLDKVYDIALEEKLQKWLQFPPDMTEKQHATQELHKEGTGRWLLDGGQFVEWQNYPGYLWIQGQSGTGKSVLSSAVIRKLFDDQRLFVDLGKTKSSAVAYFYFDFRDEKKQSVDIALRRIVLQLSPQSLDPYGALDRQYMLSKGQALPTYRDLLKVLQELLVNIGHTYIVLDALDECKEADQMRLLELISTLRSWTESPLHLLVTSQSRDIFTKAFEGVACITLQLDTTQKDIEIFVASELKVNHKLKRWAPRTDYITGKVVLRSNGMFRLAACLLVELSRCKVPSKLEKTLANLPGDLYGIYDRFLQQSSPEDFGYVKRLLLWLIFAARPVTLAELEDALAFEFSDTHPYTYDPDLRGNAVGFCEGLEGLVTYTVDYSGSTHDHFDSRSSVVSLAHASVQDYILSERFSRTFKWDVREMVRCHDRAVLSASAMHLLENGSTQFIALNQLHPFDSLFRPAWSGPVSEPIYMCSNIGYIEGVRLLLEKGADVNAQGGAYGSALQATSYRGTTEIVGLLLEKGADVNAQGGVFGSALQAASYRGNTEIMDLLLTKGADINAQGGAYGSAFQAASYRGNTEIMDLLLEKGADINAQGGEYGSALQTASWFGNTEIVGLLLEKGVDINAQGGEYGSALQAASHFGRTEFVGLFLEKGADINAQGGEYGSALQAASYRGNTEIVGLLLEKGANVNTQGGLYGSALHIASEVENTEIVCLLLEKGADVNAQGGMFRSALQAASYRGNTEIVGLLLEKGADVNAQGGVYGSALQAASRFGNTEIVGLLLQKGADINAQGGEYGSALQAASEAGNTEIVGLLLEKGADVNIQGGEYGSALQAASYRGNTEIVSLLLEKGADFNAQGGVHGRALQAASEVGNTEIVDLLLEKGANVNTQGGEYGSALQVGSYRGNTEIVGLLENGAEYSA